VSEDTINCEFTELVFGCEKRSVKAWEDLVIVVVLVPARGGRELLILLSLDPSTEVVWLFSEKVPRSREIPPEATAACWELRISSGNWESVNCESVNCESEPMITRWTFWDLANCVSSAFPTKTRGVCLLKVIGILISHFNTPRKLLINLRAVNGFMINYIWKFDIY